MIQEVITLLRTQTNYEYYFDATKDLKKDVVVYNYYDSVDNGIYKESRLELHIIVKGVDEAAIIRSEEMYKTINKVLITVADNKLTENILEVEQNGGGLLTDYNTKTIHKIMYYNIRMKGR